MYNKLRAELKFLDAVLVVLAISMVATFALGLYLLFCTAGGTSGLIVFLLILGISKLSGRISTKAKKIEKKWHSLPRHKG